MQRNAPAGSGHGHDVAEPGAGGRDIGLAAIRPDRSLVSLRTMTDYAKNHEQLPQVRSTLAGDLGPQLTVIMGIDTRVKYRHQRIDSDHRRARVLDLRSKEVTITGQVHLHERTRFLHLDSDTVNQVQVRARSHQPGTIVCAHESSLAE